MKYFYQVDTCGLNVFTYLLYTPVFYIYICCIAITSHKPGMFDK